MVNNLNSGLLPGGPGGGGGLGGGGGGGGGGAGLLVSNWKNLFYHHTFSHLDPFLGRFRRLRRRPNPRRPLRRRRRRLLQTGEAREAREAQRRQRQQRRHPARHTDLPVEADEVTLTHLRSPPK